MVRQPGSSLKNAEENAEVHDITITVNGDTVVMKGKKKISDYLTDRKFSISQKERQWVLCCGEHIAWLIGERTDNRFRIDKTTKRIVIYKIV